MAGALCACGGIEGSEGVAISNTVQFPSKGTWTQVGQAPIVFEEGYEDEYRYADDDLGIEIESAEADELLMREMDEGDRALFADDQGNLYLSEDQIFATLAKEGTGFFEAGGEINPGEVEGTVGKDIFGADDRTLWGNTTGYPARAHAALRSSPTTSYHFCSGSMIGPRHLLTAAHCIYKDGAYTKTRSQVRVVWGQDGSGNSSGNTPVLGKRRVVAWIIPNGWVNSGRRKYDYALLILDDATYSPGWLGFKAYGWTTLLGLNVNINGYPGHSYPCAASPRSDGKCGGYLYHGYGPLTFVTSDVLLTQVDWEKGQSGGPVYRYRNGSRYVVGIVSASSPVTNTAARMRSGMANALCDWIGNYPSSHFSHNCQ